MYTSAQKAHQFDCVYRTLAAYPGIPLETAKRLLKT